MSGRRGQDLPRLLDKPLIEVRKAHRRPQQPRVQFAGVQSLQLFRARQVEQR